MPLTVTLHDILSNSGEGMIQREIQISMSVKQRLRNPHPEKHFIHFVVLLYFILIVFHCYWHPISQKEVLGNWISVLKVRCLKTVSSVSLQVSPEMAVLTSMRSLATRRRRAATRHQAFTLPSSSLPTALLSAHPLHIPQHLACFCHIQACFHAATFHPVWKSLQWSRMFNT